VFQLQVLRVTEYIKGFTRDGAKGAPSPFFGGGGGGGVACLSIYLAAQSQHLGPSAHTFLFNIEPGHLRGELLNWFGLPLLQDVWYRLCDAWQGYKLVQGYMQFMLMIGTRIHASVCNRYEDVSNCVQLVRGYMQVCRFGTIGAIGAGVCVYNCVKMYQDM
jgi:hypothetical protein